MMEKIVPDSFIKKSKLGIFLDQQSENFKNFYRKSKFRSRQLYNGAVFLHDQKAETRKKSAFNMK